MSLEIADGLVQTIRGITNPDKLAHLGTVADLRAILRAGKDRAGTRTAVWGDDTLRGPAPRLTRIE